MPDAVPRFYFLGETAVALALPAPACLRQQRRIWQLAAQLRHYPTVCDVVPGMNNLTLSLDPAHGDPEQGMAWLREGWQALAADVSAPSGRWVEIPVWYGGDAGPDLAEVARHTGLSCAEVIACHSAADYRVYFLGFQPGFAYLGGLPDCLATPRRTQPRILAPAGSVGIGGSQTGIYPANSPGGWQLIGRTPLRLFDPQGEPPSLLLPGDRIRFVPQEPDHA